MKKEQICLLHTSKNKEFVHNLLQILRKGSVTSKNDHSFIKNCICACENTKKNLILTENLNVNDYLKWFQSFEFNDLSNQQTIKDKAFIQVKEAIKDIDFIKNEEMQSFTMLLGILNFIYEGKPKKDILQNFYMTSNLAINFNEQEGFNLKFQLETFVGQFIGKNGSNLKTIEKMFKCQIKILRKKEKKSSIRNRSLFFEKSKINLKICSLNFYELELIKLELWKLHSSTVYSVNKSKELREERIKLREKNRQASRIFAEKELSVMNSLSLKEVNEEKFSKHSRKSNKSSKTIKTFKIKESLNVHFRKKHYKIKALKNSGKKFYYKQKELLDDIYC
jgi:hypothetical protein